MLDSYDVHMGSSALFRDPVGHRFFIENRGQSTAYAKKIKIKIKIKIKNFYSQNNTS